ncbi:F-box/kelch-repeat protein At3g23880-like [Durio zibethinus]|uniref:F-box/kelch-repeat protein At3g23880-like n=1 Tax=Durio zibethinus TaxID=66656 RepID=A0A6P5Y1S5_DURZI|nr:F-box/kelch-repeat protein At3g23880-like [Durio zibethinus]
MSKQAMIPYNFPDEILMEIFHKLPIKSLGECMCVSKAWNFLIKSPSFVSAHVNILSTNNTNDNNNKKLFLVMTSFHGRETKLEYSLHFDDQYFSKYTQLQDIPFDTHHYIVGSCNGLVCLVDFQFSFHSKFILCNPTIRKYIRLPKPCFRNLPYKVSIGFGFDSIRNDYKLLKISKKDVLEENVEVELYSLKRNSWEILAPPKYDLYSDDFMVFVNGVVHWIACERVNNHGRSRFKFLLLGFDLGYEVFKEVMLPDSLSNLHERSEMYVMPYGELSSIAVIELALYEKCNIWVMKEYGMVETWTNMFSFRIIGNGPMPRILGFKKNGDLILMGYNDLQVVSNELQVVSTEPESGEINGFGIWGMYACVFSYMESLVLLDHVIDARGENDANNASNSIEGAAGDLSDAEDEATGDSSDGEDFISYA